MEELAAVVCRDGFEEGPEGFPAHGPFDSVERLRDRLLRPVLEFAEDHFCGFCVPPASSEHLFLYLFR
jgi:hypothetical protein